MGWHGWSLIAAMLFVSCGRLHFDRVASDASSDAIADSPLGDAAIDGAADSSSDARLDASSDARADTGPDAMPTVDPLTPFSAPIEMPGVRLVGDDPTLTGDMLEIIYEGSGLNLYRATRASIGDGWAAPVAIDELNSAEWESTPEMTYDGLTIYFASERTGQRLVYFSTRLDRGSAWAAPVAMADLQTAGLIDGDAAATPRADGGPWMTAGHSNRLLFLRRVGPDWVFERYIDEIDSAAGEGGSFLSVTNAIYFHSSRAADGLPGIYRAIRDTELDTFQAPELISEFDLPERQLDPWLSPDARTIVFVSDHIGPGPSIWQATR